MRKTIAVVLLFFACTPVVVRQADSPIRLRDYPNVFIVPYGVSMEDVSNFNTVIKCIGFNIVDDPRWADAIVLVTPDHFMFKTPAYKTLVDIRAEIPGHIRIRAQSIRRYF